MQTMFMGYDTDDAMPEEPAAEEPAPAEEAPKGLKIVDEDIAADVIEQNR